MRLLVSGASGLIGGALVARLAAEGRPAVRLLRASTETDAPAAEDVIPWQPEAAAIDAGPFEGFDAVVHLGGASIAAHRWTQRYKAVIRDSRVAGTRLLSETLARTTRRPRVLVCASAVGYYGDRGEEVLTEESPPGTGFLPEVCRLWEAAAAPAAAGMRVVHLRFGVVLSAQGGALPAVLRSFRWGLGGRVGSGRQYWSWISLEDAVGAIMHAIDSEALRGPVNAVAPEAVRNRAFAATVGRVLRRPAILPAPAWAVRLLLGEMADGLLLASCRAVPAVLTETGYAFRHPDLEGALRATVC